MPTIKEKSRGRISIAHRLYFVVGLMGLLIVLELMTLRFAMGKLSAVRAFVGGESLWSKAQKNAVFSLQRYAATRDERDFQLYRQFLAVPEGDRIARIEMLRPNPDRATIRKGFLQGKIHPDDIDPIIDLLKRFSWVSQLDRAVKVWEKADGKLEELVKAGDAYHDALKRRDRERAADLMNYVKVLNEEFTVLEEEFSNALGEGSRFMEGMVLLLLAIAVMMVETVGLGLTFLTARKISRGLDSLSQAANEFGHGRFDVSLLPKSNDEIGELSQGLSRMGSMLKKSYGDLESRVQERTADFAKLAEENARLYEDASKALQRRDEFLSLASHELKTPLTSMLLQAQILGHSDRGKGDPEHVKQFATFMERQLLRLNLLVEEMLDTSRIDLSKLVLKIGPHDLSDLLREVCTRFSPQYAKANTPLEIDVPDGIAGQFDSYRMEQVITNLLTNALKYAPGKLVSVSLRQEGKSARISVRDKGEGVPHSDRERIFGRFERGAVDPKGISGLGIGLYISKAIVGAHQGRIWVEDVQGGGANFLVELPL